MIAKFDQNLDAYHTAAYGETEARVEFINPLFEALGWDVTNKAAIAEAYKDIIHEDAVKVGGATLTLLITLTSIVVSVSLLMFFIKTCSERYPQNPGVPRLPIQRMPDQPVPPK